LYVIDVCRNLVHAVSRRYSDHIVDTGPAESTEQDIDGFIASISEKYITRRYSLYFAQPLLYFKLQRVGITVVRTLKRRAKAVFIGIEIDGGFPLKLIPCR